MKDIISIFLNDLRNIAKNLVVFVVVIGIAILPALYAWFNIAANWDPYSNTGDIPFAVCSNDLGYSYSILSIDAGEQIIDNLKKNDRMGWCFVEKEEDALEGVKNGTYYAAVIIPEDFSENLFSVLKGKFEQAELQYYVNEKKNAIAPKITDKGVQTIQESVNSAYVGTIAKVLASALKLTSGTVDGSVDGVMDKVVESLENTKNKIEDMRTAITAMTEALDKIDEVIVNNKDILPAVQEALNNGGDKVTEFKGSVANVKNVTASISNSIDGLIASSEGMVNSVNEQLTDAVAKIETDTSAVADKFTSITEMSDKIVGINNKLISVLTSIQDNFGNDLSTIISKLEAINSQQSNIEAAIDSASDSLEKTGKIPAQILSQLNGFVEGADESAKSASAVFKEVTSSISDALDGLIDSSEGLVNSVNEQLSDAVSKIETDSSSAADKFSKVTVLNEKIIGINNHLISVLTTIQNTFGIDLSAVSGSLEAVNTRQTNIKNTITSATDSLKQTGKVPAEILSQLNDYINSGDEGLKSASAAFKNVTANLSDSIDSLITSSEGMVNSVNEQLSDAVTKVETNTSSAAEKLSKLKEMNEKIIGINEKIISILTTLKESLDIDVTPVIDTVEAINARQTDIKNVVNSAADGLRKTGKVPAQILSQMKGFLDGAEGGLQSASAAFKNIKGKIDSAIDNTMASMDSVSDFLKGLGQEVPNYGTAFDNASATIQNIKKSVEGMNAYIDSAKTFVDNIISKVNLLKDDSNITSFINPVVKDPKALGEFISSPASIKSERLFSLENYGSGMAPFYTSLGFWVGGIILVAVARTDLTKHEMRRLNNPSSSKMFFGRYMIFFMLGQIQAWIIALGDLFFLKIQCDNPVLFILASLISSFVYSLIIYSLTITFSVIGKALAVIILVIQIAGSGGTFPIEVLPGAFKTLSPYLPFKYGINALREAVAGVNPDAFWFNILILLAYVPLALLLGLLLRKPCIRAMNFFNERIEQSDVII